MNRPIHFELGVVDPERAAKFYQAALGWEIRKWDGPAPYWVIVTGKDGRGIDGGMLVHQDKAPRTVNTIEVANVDESGAKVTECGGKVVVPRMAIPGVGWLIYCQDTEGNLFGMMQADPAAK